MREHMGLYRGKRKDNGEWVEGSLVVANDRINEGKHYILKSASDFSYGDNGNRIRIGCFVEVDPETVGECTGLLDENGKLIFEGDVVKYGDRIGYVVWSTGCFSVQNVNDMHRPAIDIILCEFDVEIVGNVADNPELLKGGEGDG